jgi:hypothetical protein
MKAREENPRRRPRGSEQLGTSEYTIENAGGELDEDVGEDDDPRHGSRTYEGGLSLEPEDLGRRYLERATQQADVDSRPESLRIRRPREQPFPAAPKEYPTRDHPTQAETAGERLTTDMTDETGVLDDASHTTLGRRHARSEGR